MSRTRILGVTEARLGLSVLTCILLVIGYIALQRVGGSRETPPVEIRNTVPVNNSGVTPTTNPDALHVLQTQTQTQIQTPYMSAKPTLAPPPRLEMPDQLDRDAELIWPVPPVGDGFGPPAGPVR